MYRYLSILKYVFHSSRSSARAIHLGEMGTAFPRKWVEFFLSIIFEARNCILEQFRFFLVLLSSRLMAKV